MFRKTLLATFAATLVAFSIAASNARAVIITSTDTNDFNLTLEAFPLTAFSNAPITSTSGNLTVNNEEGFGDPATTTAAYTNWGGSGMAGPEYVMSGDENFDLIFSTLQSAFAMNYEDDSVASVFTLTFFNGASNVGSTSFTTSSFNTTQFIGFSSDASFNRVAIRENDGTANSNEYFQFYTATSAVSAPDGGSTTLMMGCALLGIGGYRRFLRRG